MESRSFNRSSLRSRRGSSAVEFALTVPVLALLGLGGVEWGWYFNQHTAVQDAIRQGARSGITRPLEGQGCPSCVEVAVRRASEYLKLNGLESDQTVTATVITLDDGSLGLRVEGDVPYRAVIGSFIPSPVNIRTQTVWRLQAQP